MREIKFRTWDTKENKMIPVFTNYAGWKAMEGWNVWHDDSYIKLQYTGLKDRKGVEIYEGDIVRFDLDNYPMPCEVYYFHSGFAVSDDVGRTMLVDILTFISEGNCWHVEVLGNIYENPELLEAK